MRAEDHETAIICTNDNGSVKISITIIGKSRNPRAFQNETPRCCYFSNNKAWSNTFLLTKWLNQVFVIHSKCSSFNKVALVVGNPSSHNVYVRDGIELFPLPRYVISVHQSMLMDAIQLWKIAYKRLVLRVILKDIETRIKRQQIFSSSTRGRNSLEQGYDPNI